MKRGPMRDRITADAAERVHAVGRYRAEADARREADAELVRAGDERRANRPALTRPRPWPRSAAPTRTDGAIVLAAERRRGDHEPVFAFTNRSSRLGRHDL